MSYLAALAKVKEVVAKKALVPHLTYYLVKDGEIIATDGQVTAGAPFPQDRTFMVPAVEFDKVLNKLGDTAEINIEEGAILVTKGRYRSRINTLKDIDVFTFARPEGKMTKPPKDFVRSLRRLRPFVSDNATRVFAMAYRLRAGDMTVTNNISVARILLPACKIAFDHNIPVWAVDKVLGRGSGDLTAIQFTTTSFSFIFDDDSWLRTPLIDEKFPDETLDNLLSATPEASVELTAEWREVCGTVASLCDSTLRILPDKITGGRGQAGTEGDIESEVKALTAWDLKTLEFVLGLATHFDPSYYPKPCPWRGADVRGLIMGKMTT